MYIAPYGLYSVLKQQKITVKRICSVCSPIWGYTIYELQLAGDLGGYTRDGANSGWGYTPDFTVYGLQSI